MKAGPMVITSQERKQGCSESSGVWPSLGKGKLAPYRAEPPMLTFFLPASDANPFTWLPLAITATHACPIAGVPEYPGP